MLCPHPITLKTGDVVPCGKCAICKANERQEWVFRLKQEAKVSNYSLFVTLTYDEEHVPEGLNVNKRDVQLFLKRLRKNFASGSLRYYIVSEYGDHTFRPHYHGLFFFKDKPQNEAKLFDIITDSWQNGFCKYGKVELASIVYCTKYCLKKGSTPPGRVPVFRLMSKMNGGLGFNYIDSMGVFHVDTGNYNVAVDDGQRCRMPKYYKDLLRKNNPSYMVQQEDAHEIFVHRLQVEAQHLFKQYEKKYNNDLDACNAFNSRQKQIAKNREELILKHCKKQIL